MAQWIHSREHQIRVTARGEWLSDEILLHPRVAAFFVRHLVAQLDGSYIIRVGSAQQAISVDDAPYIITSLRIITDEMNEVIRVELIVSDGQTEWLDPRTLMQSSQHVLYCRVVRHGFAVPCRFLPGQYHEMGLLMTPRGASYVFSVNQMNYVVNGYDPRPIPLPFHS